MATMEGAHGTMSPEHAPSKQVFPLSARKKRYPSDMTRSDHGQIAQIALTDAVRGKDRRCNNLAVIQARRASLPSPAVSPRSLPARHNGPSSGGTTRPKQQAVQVEDGGDARSPLAHCATRVRPRAYPTQAGWKRSKHRTSIRGNKGGTGSQANNADPGLSRISSGEHSLGGNKDSSRTESL